MFAGTLSGAFLLGIISLLFVQHRTTLLRDFGLFILSLFMFSLASLFDQMILFGNKENKWLFEGLMWLIQSAAGFIYIGVSPFFFLRLFNIDIKSTIRFLLISVDILTVLTAFIYLFTPGVKITQTILSFFIFGTLFWEIILMIAKLFSLKDKTLKQAVSILLMVTMFFIPLLLIDNIISVLPVFHSLHAIDNLSKPLYLLVISILSIIFTFTHFNRPSFRKNNELTEYFLDKFRITPREREIIQLILRGANNKNIGETLFISPKTVENHITSIYQKTAVSSRVQLAQMIYNNSEK